MDLFSTIDHEEIMSFCVNPDDFEFSKGFRVYKNLNKRCYKGYFYWSVQAYHQKKKGWRVLAHLKSFKSDVIGSRIFESGQRKAVKEGVRNVHAMIIAERIYDIDSPFSDHDKSIEITYNPFTDTDFVYRNSERTIAKIPSVMIFDDTTKAFIAA